MWPVKEEFSLHPVMITVSECSPTSCSLLSAYPKLPFLLVTLAVAPTCFTVAAQFCFMSITNMKNLKKNCTNKCLIPTKYMTIYFLFFFFFTSHPVLELIRKSRSCSRKRRLITIQSSKERRHILVTQRLLVAKAPSYYATWTFSLWLTLRWPREAQSATHTGRLPFD